jgi:serine/threonine protein kinase
MASLGPGSRVGDYLIQRKLGQGGMGTVYLAREESQDRTVALKVLSDDLRDNQGFRLRFLQEAQTLRQLEHPNVIPVYSAGDANGVLYIATRYVPSGDLVGVLARNGNRLPARHVAEVIRQVAGALDKAHGERLVHRDVKPANILVDTAVGRYGHAYLSDFGLIRDIAAPDRMTSTGVGMGTAAYCAPEQVAGRDMDGRADQYSLACVAFELLTGRVPYPGLSGPLAFAAHVTAPVPSAARANPAVHVPPAADQVLQRAMAKDPGHRYVSCSQFANALDAALTSPGHAPTEAPKEPTVPRAPDHTPTRPPDRSSTQPPPGYRSTGVPGSGSTWVPPAAPSSPGDPTRVPSPSWPGGTGPPSSGAQTDTPPRPWRAGLIAVGATAAIVLAAVAAFAFGKNPTTTLATPSVTGSLTRTLVGPTGSLVWSVAFSPGGATLAMGEGDSIFLWSLASDKITATLTDPGSKGVDSVAFSPNGSTVAAGDEDGSTYLWSLPSDKITATLTDPGRHSVQSVAFSPNGSALAAGDFGGSTYLWSLPSDKITATLTDPRSKGVESVAFSPNGSTLAAGDGNQEANGDYRTYLWSLASRKVTAILDPGGGNGAVYSVAFSPNGSALAVGTSDGSMRLWSLASRKVTATFTDQSGSEDAVYSVAFSPNGSVLAVGDEDGSVYLWSLASGKVTATLTVPASQASESPGVDSVAFSPDGSTLAGGDDDGSSYLWHIAYPKSRPSDAG